MSWRVILSEYPQSILQDESAIAILALIESEGFAKEDQLVKHFPVSSSELARILLHLQQNSFISYSRAYVQITERGRGILDRFELGSDIARQSIQKLRLPSANAPLIEKWVEKYRAESLEEYLFTQKTAHSWANVARAFGFAEHSAEHVLAAGVAAIWVDDLRTWLSFRHRPEEAEQQDNLLFVLDNIDQQPGTAGMKHLVDALSYLRTFRKVTEQDDKLKALNDERPEHFLFACHHVSRATLVPNLWVAEWEESSECLSLISRQKSYAKLVSALRTRAVEYWAEDPKESLTTRRRQSGIDALIRRSVGDILFAILSSGSLEALQKATKMQREPLIKFLQEIRGKVSELLLEVPTSSAPQQSHNNPMHAEPPTASFSMDDPPRRPGDR